MRISRRRRDAVEVNLGSACALHGYGVTCCGIFARQRAKFRRVIVAHDPLFPTTEMISLRCTLRANFDALPCPCPKQLIVKKNPWFDSSSQPAAPKLAYPCPAGVTQRVGGCPSCLNLQNGASGGRRPTLLPFSPCL